MVHNYFVLGGDVLVKENRGRFHAVVSTSHPAWITDADEWRIADKAIQQAKSGERRVNIRAILANPVHRRKLMVDCIVATQAREGIVTTREQAEAAYDKIDRER